MTSKHITFFQSTHQHAWYIFCAFHQFLVNIVKTTFCCDLLFCSLPTMQLIFEPFYLYPHSLASANSIFSKDEWPVHFCLSNPYLQKKKRTCHLFIRLLWILWFIETNLNVSVFDLFAPTQKMIMFRMPSKVATSSIFLVVCCSFLH